MRFPSKGPPVWMKHIYSDTLCSCPKVSLLGRLKTPRKAFFVVPRLMLYYVGHFYIILDCEAVMEYLRGNIFRSYKTMVFEINCLEVVSLY